MARRDSTSSETLKVEELIRGYINHTNSNAGVELSNITLKGDDLVSILDNLGFETDKEMEEYRNIKCNYDPLIKDYTKLEEDYKKLQEDYEKLKENSEKYQPLIKSLETLIKEKIKELLKEAKQE